jgi:CBS domain containing-hemolysin-like protein
LEEAVITYLGLSVEVVVMGVVTLTLLTISALVSGSEVAFFSLTPQDLQTMREKADYVCTFQTTREEIFPMLVPARNMIEKIGTILF